MIINGKVAIVVGGARGLGKAFVQLLLENGAKVVFGDVLDDHGNKVAAEFQQQYGKHNVLYQTCDITSSQQIEALFSTAVSKMSGPVEIVANSAGICKEFEWQKTLDINVGGMIRLSTLALKYMSRQHGGSGGVIVHTSSVLAVFASNHSPVYCATKAAIVHYCNCFALKDHVELTGVRFNSLLPSMMNTELNDEAFQPGNVYFAEDHQQRIKTSNDVGDYHSTETCARALIRIITDDLNGEAVAVTPKRDFVITKFNTEQFDEDYSS